jgi:uncharacterized damage-inducible protein DinB
MKSEDFLQRMFVYDDWANREVLANLRAARAEAERPQKLLAHIVAAESLWLQRIRKEKQSLAVWPELSLEQCDQQIHQLAQKWKAVLAEFSGTLDAPVSYRNSKGEEWSSSVQDILLHVVLHSAYHRGQIATAVRASGGQPAYTDFIHAVRQKFVE